VKDAVDLVASFWTIAGLMPGALNDFSPFDFKDRVESAARAGFTGLGIWHTDLAHILSRRSLSEMKSILDDNGMRHVEVEFLTDWFLDGERKARSDLLKRDLFAAAEALGARCVKVGDFNHESCPMSRLVDSFAALCQEAAQHGTRIAFEPMSAAMLDNLEDSLRMVEGAGADNGGIMLDIWQVVNLGVPYAEVRRIPARYLVGVELNDAKVRRPGAPKAMADEPRMFCGEGEFDIDGFIAAVKSTGYAGPWGVEVISEKLAMMPLAEVTARAYQTTRAQFP